MYKTIGDVSLRVTVKGDLKAGEVYREIVYPDDLPSRVDVVGYVDPNKRIEQMIEAGLRIDAWNHAVYDYEREEDDDGYSMARERDDWDDLDMLQDAVSHREIYKHEMYMMYRKLLANSDNVSNGNNTDPSVVPSVVPSEAPQEPQEKK